jgi:endogenous inhibitor of DNA gyrase (YacG/DUF329 family)
MPTLAPAAPCPICRRPAEEVFKPFCSRRCRDVDLHRWMAGVYAIPAKPDDEESEDSASPRSDDPGAG